MQNLVPPYHDLAVAQDQDLQAAVEVALQIMGILEMVLAFKPADLLAGFPLLAVDFVAADMKVLIGKQSRHLADEIVEEVISVVPGGIHGSVVHTVHSRDLVRARFAREVGISHKPAGGMPGHVKLRNHTNAAIARVGDYVADLVLGVVLAIGGELLKLGKPLALHAEAVVVRQMPVQDVELDRFHAIKIAFDDLNRHEVAGDVHEQAAPWKTRTVFDHHPRRGESFRTASSQLKK